MTADGVQGDVARLVEDIVNTVERRSPAELLSLCVLDEFDDAAARLLVPDEDCSAAIEKDPTWRVVYETIDDRHWATRELLRGRLRLAFARAHERLFQRAVDRLVETAIGDQLSDPLSLAVWYCRYKMDPIASAGLHGLIVEEPELAYRCMSIIRSQAATLRTFRSGYVRLRNTIGDWLPTYDYLASKEAVSARQRALRFIVDDWGPSRTPPRAMVARDEVAQTMPYIWPVAALADAPRAGHKAKLRWEPMAVREGLQAISSIALESRRQIGSSPIGQLEKRQPTDQFAGAASALSVSWWRQRGTRELVRSASEDVNQLVSALSFPLAEVERVTHQISVTGSRTAQRSMVLTLRPSPTAEHGAQQSPEYAVLWHIPDSAGRASDFQIRGADGLPVQGPSDEAIIALRLFVDQLLRHDLDNDYTFGGPKATLIPASYYARLERLLTQTWRVVRMPQSRAEGQITVTWTEEIDRRITRLPFGTVLNGLTFPLQTSGFSPREHYMVQVDTPPDLTVRSLELRVPQRSVRPDMPDHFTDSTLLLRLRLSWAARRYIAGVPILLGLLALLVSLLLPDNSSSSREVGAQLSYLLFAVAPAAVSFLVESRRRSGPARWALRGLRYVVLGFATLSSVVIIFTLIPLKTSAHELAQLGTLGLGVLMLLFGVSLAIITSFNRNVDIDPLRRVSAGLEE